MEHVIRSEIWCNQGQWNMRISLLSVIWEKCLFRVFLSPLKIVMFAYSICNYPGYLAKLTLMISLWKGAKYLGSLITLLKCLIDQAWRLSYLWSKQKVKKKMPLFFKADLRGFCYQPKYPMKWHHKGKRKNK